MNKVLLITGGSRGIGAATARLAAEQGYAVAINYASEKARAVEIAQQVKNSCIIQANVTLPDDVERMFAEAETKLGKITHVVNSAGITGKASRLTDAATDVIRSTIDTNVLGTIYVCREAVKRMTGHGGVIINLSSGAATLGSPNEFVWYAASKGAVDTFTLGLGREVADLGIRVCGVAPGLTDTDMQTATGVENRLENVAPGIPFKRAASAEEIAETILFLMSDKASYITATTLRVAGGR